MTQLPHKVWLRRKEVESAVGGRRQLETLERSGTLTGVVLPGYKQRRFARAAVQEILGSLGGR
jgi:hypothetical protein